MVRWRRGQQSENVEDRRSQSGGFGGLGGSGGLGGLGSILGGGKGGMVGLVLVAVMLFAGKGCGVPGQVPSGGGGGGFDIGDILDQFPGTQAAPPGADPLDDAPAPDDEAAEFMGFVLDDVQATWTEEFEGAGRSYPETTLVLFRQGVNTGCGAASSATGPFYCPLDSKVYIDLGFFQELQSRFGAPGDFAQAYVLAHEVGHHVQNVLGINPRVRELQQQNPARANELSIRQELQADCLAGIWAHSAFERDLLEDGDLEEGIQAAAAVGDDRIQESTTGRVNPEAWTHGSSEQRIRWFRVGFDSGDSNRCDTFELDDGEL